jgi:hypothetical protein
MVYLLKMVIFHGYVSHNQMVNDIKHEFQTGNAAAALKSLKSWDGALTLNSTELVPIAVHICSPFIFEYVNKW